MSDVMIHNDNDPTDDEVTCPEGPLSDDVDPDEEGEL